MEQRAHAAEEQAAGSRPLFLIALLTLSVAGAVAFARVYQGHGIVVRLALVAAASTLLAGALERRHVAIGALASAAGLALTVGFLVFPGTTAYLLPTARTLHAATAAISVVGRTADLQTAPTPPVAPLLLAGVIAVWTAAFASHALAVRARSPFLATVPPGALLAFAGMVMEDGARPAYVVFFLAAALLVVFADALRRVGTWGPLTVWHGRRSHGLAAGAPLGSASRVAIACLAIGTIVPFALPGFRSAGLVSLSSGPGRHVSINPMVEIRARLLQNPVATLFTVRASHASYWRFLSLDEFNGRAWIPVDPRDQAAVQVMDGHVGPSPCPGAAGQLSPFIPSPVPAASGGPSPSCHGAPMLSVHQQFHIAQLAQSELPVASGATSISTGQAIRYDPANGAIILPDGTFSGFSYQVTSSQVVPTPAQLNAVTSMLSPQSSYFTTLPPGIPSTIRRIAEQWTAGATTPYQKILDIQRHFRTAFAYDAHVAAAGNANAMVYFLTHSHRGYCQQFAGTMAVMLRELGIPARVAVGFVPGTYDETTQTYTVTTQDAHAWVEVLFPTYGWLQFEPTPSRVNPVALPYEGIAAPSASIQCANPTTKGHCIGSTTPPPSTAGPSRADVIKHRLAAQGIGHGVSAPGPTRSPTGSPWRDVGLPAALAVLVLLGIGIPAEKTLRRRTLVARARTPNGRVLAAYRVLLDQAFDAGFARGTSETPAEYAVRVGATVGGANGDLAALTRLATRAAYGPVELTGVEAAEAQHAARRLARKLRRAAGILRVAAGWFRLHGLASGAAVRYRTAGRARAV